MVVFFLCLKVLLSQSMINLYINIVCTFNGIFVLYGGFIFLRLKALFSQVMINICINIVCSYI